MKLALGLASVLLLAGCASGPYYSGYGGYGYQYDTYRPDDYGTTYYPGYGTPLYFGYPAISGGVYFQDRDHDRRRWNRGDRDDGDDRGRRGRWRDREPDASGPGEFGGHGGGPVYSDRQPIPPGQQPGAQGR